MVVYNWVMSNMTVILGVLFGVSEALSFIPGVAANGVFQAIYNFLKGKQAK